VKVAFIRTPRYVWPFNSETSAFWQPLGFMSLAGQMEISYPDWSAQIVDCPGSKIGWKTLGSILSNDWPDIVCIGEETVSSHEAMQLARIVKERHPSTIVIAGGIFFSSVPKEALSSGLIDHIVHGEGEIGLSELLCTISDGGDIRDVKGISFREEGQIKSTAARSPIADMDSLPMPAWSKVSMRLYGQGSKNHPGLISIEHSRGCTDKCSFCSLWKHMGRPSQDGKTVEPHYRSKSAQRSFEEVMRLVRDFDRHTFGWVDPTWNADPRWTDGFCDLLLEHNVKIRQTAWLRADYVVRDEELGILEKAVRAGLCQVMIGVERMDKASLEGLNKHSNGPDVTTRAFEIFRNKYPKVFTIGSVIFGLWDETRRSLDELSRCCYKAGMDYCFFIPLTPNPGTLVYDEAIKRGTIQVLDRRAYNFHTPVMRSKLFSAKQLDRLYFRLLLGVSIERIVNHLRRLFTVRDERHRRVYKALCKYGILIAVQHIASRVCHPFSQKPTIYSRKPIWYDS